MDLGQAFEALKKGKKIYRIGWNGKGMFLFMVGRSQINASNDPALAPFITGMVTMLEHVLMKTSDGSLVPWLCSQIDSLADDWEIITEYEGHLHTHNCPSRGVRPADASFNDYWYIRDHYRTCSYCGSLHPDAFMASVKDGCKITPTDKSYKAYIAVPDNPHAKFYFEHLSEAQKHEFVQLINDKKLNFTEPGYFYVLPFFVKVL